MTPGHHALVQFRSLTALLLMASCLLAAWLATSQAQVKTSITSDGTLGTAVTQNANVYDITGGTRLRNGPNLFHSFDRFSVGTNDIARFSGPTGIENILSRVTGGQQSIIDGRLQLTIPGANLYLLNPSGVLFGPNAALDVSGSFHVSTADYLRFADGATFAAHLGVPSTLTVASPAAFGFLGENPAAIAIQGSTLLVSPGKTMSVIGGDIDITGGLLFAPRGHINMVSAGSRGAVPLADTGLDVEPLQRLGNITIVQNGGLRVDGEGAGTIFIRGGRLVMDNAIMRAQTLRDADGGGVDIAAQRVTLTGGSSITSTTFGAGRGGRITVAATDDILITGRSQDGRRRSGLFSLTASRGDAGDVLLSAPRISLDDGAEILVTTVGGGGNAGNMVMHVGRLTLTGGALIDSSALLGAGRAGSVSITATEAVVIAGRDRLPSPPLGIFFRSSILSLTDSNSNAGRITLSTPVLRMDDGLIGTSTFGAGRAGDIVVEVGTLTLVGGAQVDSSSRFGVARGPNGLPIIGPDGLPIVTPTAGGGGTVTVTATEAVSITGSTSDGTPSGLLSQAESFGAAGRITLTAPTVSLGAGGVIETRTTGAGRAGDILVQVGHLSLTGGAQIDSSTRETGEGGSITVMAETIALMDKATIRSSTDGDASGGRVTLTAQEGITLRNGAGVLTESTAGRGRGGDISLEARHIQLADRGLISAQSFGAGNAGSIRLMARETFQSDHSTVTTEARQADGGDIQVTAQSTLRLRNSQMTTAVGSGEGAGGNITIDPEFVVLGNSRMTANAFGGPGGNIRLTAGVFLADPASSVSASSALGIDGQVDIRAPVTNLSAVVTPLPPDFAPAATLLRDQCAARLREGTVSSLVERGRDGVPATPDGVLPSRLYTARPAEAGQPASEPRVARQRGLPRDPNEPLARREWRMHTARCGEGTATSK